MSHPHHYDLDGAKAIGDAGRRLDQDRSGTVPQGLEVEFEHGSSDPETNVTNDDPVLTGKIAWAHLKEIPDYYDRLEEMEDEAEAYWEAAEPDRSDPMIVTTKELFEVAYGKFAVGAYNINNMEQTLGLFQGNLDSQAPFIIQISSGARSYADKRMLEAMIKAADEIFPEAIFAVHLDHGDLATALDCIESGFYSSVMIDASREPLEENIRITRQVVDAAHAARHLGGSRTGPAGRGGGARAGGGEERPPHRSRPRPRCS